MSLAFLEYEEQFGRLWDRLVGGRASLPRFADAAVALEDERRRLAVLFRAMGGDHGLELVAGSETTAHHRLNFAQRLGMSEERLLAAERTSELVLLPPVLDCLPTVALNRDLYVWLVAFLARAEPSSRLDDPLQHDLARLHRAAERTQVVLHTFPGLAARYTALAAAHLEQRPARHLPSAEAEVEALVRHLHGCGPAPAIWTCAPADVRAPRGYRPFLPSPLWGEVRAESGAAATVREEAERAFAEAVDGAERHRRARRRGPESGKRSDPLTLINKGEYLLLAAESVNVSRPDDDEDPDAARRAADDMDELTLGSPDRRAASRVRMNLDIADSATAAAAPAGTASFSYPEWDHRRGSYRQRHCAVQAGPAADNGEDWAPDAPTRRHIRLVRRRFEALRPRREVLRAQADGGDFDMDALVRARADLAAGAVGSDRVHLDVRNRARDLAIAILVDTSFSTDSWVEGRRVLDVEKAALTALAFGLEACGDPFAILTFSSHKRLAVAVDTVKGFEERLDAVVRRRIAALRPGAYTRIGAAVRHVAAQLDTRPERHRLLLLLSDGKPNDLDHYEGRYAVEDSRKAVQEARGRGLAVFAVTVDRRAEHYLPRIFGRGGYAIVGHLGRLPDALPAIYRQLVT